MRNPPRWAKLSTPAHVREQEGRQEGLEGARREARGDAPGTQPSPMPMMISTMRNRSLRLGRYSIFQCARRSLCGRRQQKVSRSSTSSRETDEA